MLNILALNFTNDIILQILTSKLFNNNPVKFHTTRIIDKSTQQKIKKLNLIDNIIYVRETIISNNINNFLQDNKIMMILHKNNTNYISNISNIEIQIININQNQLTYIINKINTKTMPPIPKPVSNPISKPISKPIPKPNKIVLKDTPTHNTPSVPVSNQSKKIPIPPKILATLPPYIKPDIIEWKKVLTTEVEILRMIRLPKIERDQPLEAVFIMNDDDANINHIELTIRNCIARLGDKWTHTIICNNNENQKRMCEVIKNIGLHIKVFKMRNILLTSREFWDLLKGDKIFIYHENTFPVRNNIQDFMEWDYVYDNTCITDDINPNRIITNLCTRSIMINIIDKVTNENENKSTDTNLQDVHYAYFFINNMNRLKIGNVANNDILQLFCNSGDENNFFIDKNIDIKKCVCLNSSKQFYRKIVPKIHFAYTIKSDHRGGWGWITEELTKNCVNKKGIRLYDVLDSYFLWMTRFPPLIGTSWTGFIHGTPITPSYSTHFSIDNILTHHCFIESLKKCVCLFTLSQYITDHILDFFKKQDIKTNVYTLKHPTMNVKPIHQFNIKKYLNTVGNNNNNKLLLQIGFQMRRISSIYRLKLPNYKKIWLTGCSSDELSHERLMDDFKENNITNYEELMKDVSMLYFDNFGQYDSLLANNIVFVDLYDAACNNTVVECIIRNTPIIINKVGGVSEYLGDDYPLYFTKLSDVPKILNNTQKIIQAHSYLANMNKDFLDINYFKTELMNSLYNATNNCSLDTDICET